MEQLSLITYEDGIEIIYEVIATYHDEEASKDFVVYTDKTTDKNNKLNIFYSLYCIENNKIKLLETTDVADQKIGLELIKEIGMML